MSRQEIMLPQLGEPLSHYAHAVRFGDLLFISGCAPLDANGQLVGRNDVKAQTRQVLEHLRTTLEAVGLGPGDVLKVTVYLMDVDDRARINPLRRAFFGSTLPASTLVEVSRLAVPGMRVEIEAIAGFSNAPIRPNAPNTPNAAKAASAANPPKPARAARTAETAETANTPKTAPSASPRHTSPGG
jgi:2-iminobutanoate/2-iminopropanoate deaminase